MVDQREENKQKNSVKENQAENNRQMAAGKFREASYVVLFIAAVFIINAMETGSYRTPWPVAIVATMLGIGLFGYSHYLLSRKQ